MKNRTLTSISMLGLFLMLAVAAVQAQSGTRIEANVPFDFSAGDSTFPAGVYTFHRISDRSLMIRSADGKVRSVVPAPLAIGAQGSRGAGGLVFNRYENDYFLFQVWLKADSGRQLFPSKTEQKLAQRQQIAKRNELESVEVAARPR